MHALSVSLFPGILPQRPLACRVNPDSLVCLWGFPALPHHRCPALPPATPMHTKHTAPRSPGVPCSFGFWCFSPASSSKSFMARNPHCRQNPLLCSHDASSSYLSVSICCQVHHPLSYCWIQESKK